MTSSQQQVIQDIELLMVNIKGSSTSSADEDLKTLASCLSSGGMVNFTCNLFVLDWPIVRLPKLNITVLACLSYCECLMQRNGLNRSNFVPNTDNAMLDYKLSCQRRIFCCSELVLILTPFSKLTILGGVDYFQSMP